VEELRLLIRARQADARGDFSSVLPVLAEHQRLFPAGRLAEEREVLRVKALVGLGRNDEARQTADNFRRRFPRSVLLHRVEDMLTSSR
jgi:outer membrane protein assembly factor BamD (BamD/ComL family)